MQMTRRDWLLALPGAAVAMHVGINPYRMGRVYRHVTIEMASARNWLPARVHLDGVNVADQCVELNDEEGWVVLRHFENGQLLRVKRFGRVEFYPAT